MAMASEAAASDKAAKLLPRKQNKPDQPKRYRSIFEVPPNFFDSCRLFHSTSSPLPDFETSPDDGESKSENELTENRNDDDYSSNNVKIMQRWSCNTCKSEFESLQEQRFHFKSDLHRFNIKLNIAGKSIIKEEEFDEATSDLLYKDYDVSSISGSDDEDERENSVLSDRQREIGGLSKRKICIQLKDGEIVSVWKCLLLDESDSILYETDKPHFMDGSGVVYLKPKEVIEKLKYILHEPRDNSRLRIVLLAKGGHFAGCVFDGNSLVAHKTFHRYVVRAKAGKKQSLKDGGGGQTIHSAGASLRRYNELGLKKDIQELLTLWKPHFAVASCIFIHAPSDNRQLLFDGDKPYFICHDCAIRNIPLTVRRPTMKEARRIYSLLIQVSSEIIEEIPLSTKEESLSRLQSENQSYTESSGSKPKEDLEGTKAAEASSFVTQMDDLSVSVEPGDEMNAVGISTRLHEAAKSGHSENVLELLEQGLDPCVKDERGQTPYMLASDKEVRNMFRRFMASNLEKWDWHAAKVPSPLTKEMEESQAAKQAEKDAKRKAKAKELKKLKKAKEKKAQAEAESSTNLSKSGNLGGASVPTKKGQSQYSGSAASKEEELKRIQDMEREKRAAAAERRIAALNTQGSAQPATPSNLQSSTSSGSDILCSCCFSSLAGKVPFHRYNYKYCSTSCMHLHREILEDG